MTLSDEDRDWLKFLQDSLWEWIPERPYRAYGHMNELRSLTTLEWGRVAEIASCSKNLFFETKTCHGFTLQIAIWEDAPYPGTDPTFLVLIDQKQLPEELGTAGPTGGGSGDSWKAAWKIFSAYTHSERNAEKLAVHGRKPPKSEGHYQY